MKKFKCLILSLLLVVGLTGCSYLETADLSQQSNNTSNYNSTENSLISNKSHYYSSTSWNENYPDYIRIYGYADIDENSSDFNSLSQEEKDNGCIKYSELDGLQRPHLVYGVITYEMRRQGTDRERSDMPNPIGWTYAGSSNNKQVEINLLDGTTYKGAFYNRSHLIAKSLGGQEIKENLITATRTQNVGKNDGNGGMAYAENLIRNYLDSHKDQKVLYRVTPIYQNNELLPRSIFVDMKTEDNVLNEHIEIFNYCYGYQINYNTGQFEKS